TVQDLPSMMVEGWTT
nr:immunoglobulin heavy chain junction region [Mus musculus]